MVIVTGIMRVKAEDRAGLLAAWEVMKAATHREPGCRAYDLWADRDDANAFRLYEEWATAADLEMHFATAHMASYKAAISGFEIDRSLQVHDVSSSREL